MFWIVYAVIALIIFIALEVFSVVQCKFDNAMFKIPVYSPNHFRLIVSSVFFPIFILIIAISVVTELIIERKK